MKSFPEKTLTHAHAHALARLLIITDFLRNIRKFNSEKIIFRASAWAWARATVFSGTGTFICVLAPLLYI